MDSDLTKPAATASTGDPRYGRFAATAKLLTTFLAGHGVLQALNIFTGLFLLRQLSIEGYAEYSLALAFQTTAISLTNLGLTDSIIPLVGSRAADHKLVGTYVQAARLLRTRLFLVVAPCCAGAFLLIVRGHQWTDSSVLILLFSILASLYFSVSVSCWSAPLILNRRLYDYYLGQWISSAARLGVYVLASAGNLLSAVFASLTGVASILLNGIIVKARAAEFVELPTQVDKSANREVLRCMLPMMPAALFTSFQPQVALLLVSIFGQTLQIAQIAALSRIAQLFLIFSTFSTLVVEPYIARLPPGRLLLAYIRVVGCAIFVGGILTLLSFIFPQALLWILGPKYADLDNVVGWVVLSSALSTTANVIWVMNRGRRWLFWRGSFLEISGLIVFQTAYVVMVGVRTTFSAALFMLAASGAHLVAHAYVMVYGLMKHRQLSASA